MGHVALKKNNIAMFTQVPEMIFDSFLGKKNASRNNGTGR